MPKPELDHIINEEFNKNISSKLKKTRKLLDFSKPPEDFSPTNTTEITDTIETTNQ